jgi:GNAT superfamily N-acetyltransferase
MTADTGSAELTGGLVPDVVGPDFQEREDLFPNFQEPEVLSADSWRELRDVRLAALRESPHAFVSTIATERLLEDADWRTCIESATWVAVRDGKRIVGVACSLTTQEEPLARYVESVWVDARYRCRGILTAMLEKLRRDAWLRGATQLRLWVLDTNGSAQQAYLRLNFHVDSGQKPVDTKKRRDDDTFVKEQQMYRDIASPFL